MLTACLSCAVNVKWQEIGKLNDSLKEYRKREKKGVVVKMSSKERQNLTLVAEEAAELDSMRTEGLRKVQDRTCSECHRRLTLEDVHALTAQCARDKQLCWPCCCRL